MKISAGELRKMKACSESIEWFFGKWGELEVEIAPETLAACDNDSWVCWLACQKSEDYRYWCTGVSFREKAKVHPELSEWSMNVTPENWKAARAAAYDAGVAYAGPDSYAAIYARPADIDGIWRELRNEAERVLLRLE